jgi:hypothetical protein
VTVNDKSRAVLLFHPKENVMLPLCTDAFSVAEGRKKKLADRYRDALILDCDGSIRKIEQLQILGLCGKSFLGKLCSFVFGLWWNIEVHLSEPLPFSLEEIKKLVIDCIHNCHDVLEEGEDAWSPLNLDIDAIRAAQDFDALWSALALDLEDTLDVLC